jgi:pimeloyl-ACP methyl ester carboxylesterase
MRRFRHRVGDIVTPFIESGPGGRRGVAVQGGSEDAVLFVHGNPGSGEEFADLVERIGEQRRAVAFDMPGFGRADKPDPAEGLFDHTVDGYARHLAEVVDSLSLQRVHLVLHDLGGPWGLRFAAQHPERVASVVLINAGGMPGYRWHLPARVWRRPGLGEAAMRATNRTGFGLALRAGNPIPIPEPHIETMYANFDAATRRTVLAFYRATDETELDRVAQGASGLTVPVLVIWGEVDPFLPLTDAQRFRRVFPDARFVRIAGSGHWPHLTTPEPVEDALVAWLRPRVPI